MAPSPWEMFDVISVRRTAALYVPGQMVGKSTAQVGHTDRGGLTGQDSEVYTKWSQALASASDFVAEAARAHEAHGVPEFSTFVMPMLVVSDGTLWAADYSEAGELQSDPYHVQETTVYVGHGQGTPLGPYYTFTHLHFVTRTRLPDILADIAQDAQIWNKVFPNRVA
jgi:hypothetical protein